MGYSEIGFTRTCLKFVTYREKIVIAFLEILKILNVSVTLLKTVELYF